MRGAPTMQKMWGVSLCKETLKTLRKLSLPGVEFKHWLEGTRPDVDALRAEDPFLVFIPWRVWRDMSENERAMWEATDTAFKALVADASLTREDLEAIVEQHFSAVVKKPLSVEKMRDIASQALDARQMFQNLENVTREICLERELLARKNMQLRFINRLLTKATVSLDPTAILNSVLQELRLLLPVSMLHGVFWNPVGMWDNEGLDVEIFAPRLSDAALRREWRDLLLRNAARLSMTKVRNYRVNGLAAPARATSSDAETIRPKPRNTMHLPLSAGDQIFGCLALLLERPVELDREHTRLLHSGLKHLGLALHNSFQYRMVKHFAEYDSLTRMYNRRSLEIRFKEELARNQRFGGGVSLLMLDIDHFKRLNDTRGHQCGDHVLSELGSHMSRVVRNTDIVGRFGGEEFMVLLPQTGMEQAMTLAERLRHSIAAKRFFWNTEELNITVSIGAASVNAGSAESMEDVLRRADEALYAAKQGGRNRVCPA